MPHIAVQKGIFYNAICVLCSIKGYLLQKDIAKDQTKNNFIRNSSLVTSGLNFLKDNILRRDELRFKLITRL